MIHSSLEPCCVSSQIASCSKLEYISVTIQNWESRATWFQNEFVFWEYTERLLVADEGTTLENLSLDFTGCRNACDRNPECKSFSHATVDCRLKKKCVSESEADNISAATLEMKTYYKSCEGSLIYKYYILLHCFQNF